MGRYVFFRLDINKDGKEDKWVALCDHSAKSWKARINNYEGFTPKRKTWDGTFWYVAAYENDAGDWYLVDKELIPVWKIET